MQLSVERPVLLKALGHVQSVVERRGTIPVLAHVKLEAKIDGGAGQLTLTGTDMDMSLAFKVPAQVTQSGSTTIAAHTLYDIVRKLSDAGEIRLTMKDSSKVQVSAGKSNFQLSTLPVEEFPVMEEEAMTHHFSLTAAQAKQLVAKPAYAMSSEETRYYLNGIYWHCMGDGEGRLRSVATDGHRLSRIEVPAPKGASGMPGIIVPRKTVFELLKLLDGVEALVNVSVSDTKIRLVVGQAILLSKLIDGTFPDYERVIPSNNTHVMTVAVKDLTQAVDRVAVIASERSRGVRLHLSDGKLTVSASSAEHGSGVEELDVEYGGDTIEIGFNSRYMLEMLGVLEGDSAELVFNDGVSPVLTRDSADAGALYVIMPMRV